MSHRESASLPGCQQTTICRPSLTGCRPSSICGPFSVRASATFPGLSLLRGSSDVVRARITKASIACQNIASAVAVFERVILAVPIRTTRARVDHRAPKGASEASACRGPKLTDARAAAASKIVRVIFRPPIPVLINNTKEAVAISTWRSMRAIVQKRNQRPCDVQDPLRWLPL